MASNEIELLEHKLLKIFYEVYGFRMEQRFKRMNRHFVLQDASWLQRDPQELIRYLLHRIGDLPSDKRSEVIQLIELYQMESISVPDSNVQTKHNPS